MLIVGRSARSAGGTSWRVISCHQTRTGSGRVCRCRPRRAADGGRRADGTEPPGLPGRDPMTDHITGMSDAAPTGTPLDHGIRMPPETPLKERTLMAWPCAVVSSGERAGGGTARLHGGRQRHRRLRAGDHGGARRCRRSPGPARARRGRPPGRPAALRLLDALLRADLHPGLGRPPGRGHFRFNAWGEYSSAGTGRGRRAAPAEIYGDVTSDAPIVLRAGRPWVDGQGGLVTTEQCLLGSEPESGAGPVRHRGARRAPTPGVTEVVWLWTGAGRRS